MLGLKKKNEIEKQETCRKGVSLEMNAADFRAWPPGLWGKQNQKTLQKHSERGFWEGKQPLQIIL